MKKLLITLLVATSLVIGSKAYANETVIIDYETGKYAWVQLNDDMTFIVVKKNTDEIEGMCHYVKDVKYNMTELMPFLHQCIFYRGW